MIYWEVAVIGSVPRVAASILAPSKLPLLLSRHWNFEIENIHMARKLFRNNITTWVTRPDDYFWVPGVPGAGDCGKLLELMVISPFMMS